MVTQKKKKLRKHWIKSKKNSYRNGEKTAPNQRQQIRNAHTIFCGIISVGLLSLQEGGEGCGAHRVLCTILRRLKVRATIQISVNLAACPALAFCFCLPACLTAVVYIFLRSAWVLFACGKKRPRRAVRIYTDVRMCTEENGNFFYLLNTSKLKHEIRYLWTGKTKYDRPLHCNI